MMEHVANENGLRVGVVGLGAAGLAAAWAAAKDGCRVVGYEQSDLDNQPASSGGRGKIIRFGYDDPFYADLMSSTMPRWESLARQTGRTLMRRHGGLHFGDVDAVATVAGAIRRAEQPHDVIGPSDARLAQFGIAIGAGESAVYEPSAGVMDTTQVRMALAEAARAAGAALREHSAVTAIEPVASGPVGFRIRTADGVDECDRVIVAGGPWAFRLVPEAADAFAITRRFQLVFRTGAPLGDGRPRPWMDYSGAGYYGMINLGGEPVHIAGLHQHDREQHVHDPGEPDDPAIRAESIAEVSRVVAARFGLTEPLDVLDVRACHYTSTPSTDFVIDYCPGLPGAVLLSACSGHGFKFTITTGALAASAATGADVPHRFRLGLASRT